MKYPKTLHLPYSPGLTKDDKKIKTTKYLEECHVIVTEKLDGENTCLEHDKIHARSENSTSHPSRNRIKKLHAEIRHLISANDAVFGENVYAKHSIEYDSLNSSFYIFAIYDKASKAFYSWHMTRLLAKEYGLRTVPEIYEGPWKKKFEIPNKSAFGPTCEGFVVRKAGPVPLDEYDRYFAKYVRADHVQTDEHWKRNWVPNPQFRK